MWKCKFCKNNFSFTVATEKASHARWCSENPNSGNTESLKLAQKKIADNKFGIIVEFFINCFHCEKQCGVYERLLQFPRKSRYFCSQKCSNSICGNAKSILSERLGELTYRSIALKYHDKQCIVCGFDKIIEIHHINENNRDHRKENLVILCPNHHQMYHSRFKEEIKVFVDEYLFKKWGI